jgi:hypothetical protein
MTLEGTLVAVWQQAMVDGADAVELGGKRFPVHLTPRKKLREVDFEFRGQPLRGLEQNPRTGSRWAEMARSGAKVMQFLSEGRYVGVVADGKVTMYSKTVIRRGAREESPKKK